MLATARFFTNGNNHAIRLPKEFRVDVDVDEMWIARNEVTVKITLKPIETKKLRHRRLDELMVAIAKNPLTDNFLSDASRQNNPPKNLGVIGLGRCENFMRPTKAGCAPRCALLRHWMV